MTETTLEQLQRHVTTGAERIARQEALICGLESGGRSSLLHRARVLLDQLKAAQKLGEEHLAREKSRTAST